MSMLCKGQLKIGGFKGNWLKIFEGGKGKCNGDKPQEPWVWDITRCLCTLRTLRFLRPRVIGESGLCEMKRLRARSLTETTCLTQLKRVRGNSWTRGHGLRNGQDYDPCEPYILGDRWAWLGSEFL